MNVNYFLVNLEFIVKLWKIYFYYNLLLLFVSIALIIGTVLKCIKQEITLMHVSANSFLFPVQTSRTTAYKKSTQFLHIDDQNKVIQ